MYFALIELFGACLRRPEPGQLGLEDQVRRPWQHCQHAKAYQGTYRKRCLRLSQIVTYFVIIC